MSNHTAEKCMGVITNPWQNHVQIYSWKTTRVILLSTLTSYLDLLRYVIVRKTNISRIWHLYMPYITALISVVIITLVTLAFRWHSPSPVSKLSSHLWDLYHNHDRYISPKLMNKKEICVFKYATTTKTYSCIWNKLLIDNSQLEKYLSILVEKKILYYKNFMLRFIWNCIKLLMLPNNISEFSNTYDANNGWRHNFIWFYIWLIGLSLTQSHVAIWCQWDTLT